jgi:nitrogen fixation/metabolism regulation signal transduction histidine kinase
VCKKPRIGFESVIDAVSEAVVVVDDQGVIRCVNRAWREFALANAVVPGQSVPRTDVGSKYLQVCQDAAARGSDDARTVLDGIRSVLQ